IRTKTEPRRRRVRREGCGSRRTLFHRTRTRHRAGLRVSHRCESVRASVAFGSATYLREEPDALRSARPDPSGGYYASGIPTGFINPDWLRVFGGRTIA